MTGQRSFGEATKNIFNSDQVVQSTALVSRVEGEKPGRMSTGTSLALFPYAPLALPARYAK